MNVNYWYTQAKSLLVVALRSRRLAEPEVRSASRTDGAGPLRESERARWMQASRRLIAACMAVVGVSAVVGCGVQAGAGTGTASAAASRPAGLSSTAMFLAARRALAHAVETGLGASEAAVEREVASLGLRCRRIAAPAPPGIVFEELSDDALIAIEITMTRGSASALTQFSGATEALRWGSMPLTSLVRGLAEEARALARVAPLGICAVFADWARSGYRAMPAAATRFQREIHAVSSRGVTHCRRVSPHGRSICLAGRSQPTGTAIQTLLKRDEDGTQREEVRGTEQIERGVASRTRATLTRAASGLTQDLALDRFALRLFVASLR
jgi:hypothetical protein